MKIAIDVDDVLAAFTPHAHDFFGHELEVCDYWCPITMDGKFGTDWFNGKIAPIREFWDTLPLLSKPEDIDFDFECYISAFPFEMFESRWDWLQKHGFPNKPLICSFQKLAYCKENEIDTIIDDKPTTIKQFNEAGLKGIHFITPYAGFDPVGDCVITNLNQVKGCL
jgi:hypothetical protein